MSGKQQKNYRNIVIMLLALHLVLLGIFAANRIVDADEGFYLNAARMISDGMAPYSDFFYTQFAGLPLTFSHLASGGWDSFYLMRAAAVLAGFFSALLLSAIIYKITGNMKSVTIGLFMYAFSGMSLVWHSTFKVIPFTGLFSLAAFYFWLLFRDKQKTIFLIMCGLFLSLLISYRSLFMVLLPFYIVSVYFISRERKWRNVVIMLVSMVPFSLPNLLVIFNSFEQFYYGNVLFQMARDANRAMADVIMNRLFTLYRIILDPHLVIIFALAVISVILLARKKRIASLKEIIVKPEGMAVANLILIGIVFMIPHPMARRYVDNYLAYAVIVGVLSLTYVYEWLRERIKPGTVKMLIGGAAAIYVISLVPYIVIFLFGVRGHEMAYRISNVKEVTDHMLSTASRADTVLSEWAGYTFITEQTPLEYTEIVGFDLGLPFTHEEYMTCKLCDREYLEDQVALKIPNLIVLQNHEQPYYSDLLTENYDRTFNTDLVAVYKRK
ncbi:MAG: hypothetical protein AB1746_07905 [Candidatus Zixiibacteriota bacterium]